MQDYFKEVEEESVRDNFVICYELLDEMVDFGYPQTTDAQILQVGSPISSQYCEILTTTDQSAASIHIQMPSAIAGVHHPGGIQAGARGSQAAACRHQRGVLEGPRRWEYL